MATKYPDKTLAELAEHLVAAFAAAGCSRPVLPAGRRDDYAKAVSHFLCFAHERQRYLSHLKAAISRRGLFAQILEFAAGAELPIEQLIRDGVAVIGDEDLAALGLVSIALENISELLEEEMAANQAAEYWWEIARPARPSFRTSFSGEATPRELSPAELAEMARFAMEPPKPIAKPFARPKTLPIDEEPTDL